MSKGRIISFTFTKDAFLAGAKTCTRRQWKDSYALSIKPGDIMQAYDKVPFVGGKKIGEIEIVSIAKEPIADMPVFDFAAEGFEWLRENGIYQAKGFPYDFTWEGFQKWHHSGKEYWVVRFKKI